MKPSSKRLLYFALLALLAPVVILLLSVTDWTRDLTTNIASTSDHAKDPTLRPLIVQMTADQISDSLRALCDSSSNWRYPEEPTEAPADAEAMVSINGPQIASHHLVHVSSLMRYRDDVWVILEETGTSEIRIHAESRSRLGKGDLGQNPRNLRQLLSWLRDH